MITKIHIKNFCKELKIKYSALQTIKLDITTNDKDEKILRLVTILIKKSKRNSGSGVAVMNDVINFSNKHEIPLELKAADIYGSDLDRLIKFYERLGFNLIGENYMRYSKKEN